MTSEQKADAHKDEVRRELRKRRLVDAFVVLLLVFVVVVLISSCLKFT